MTQVLRFVLVTGDHGLGNEFQYTVILEAHTELVSRVVQEVLPK